MNRFLKIVRANPQAYNALLDYLEEQRALRINQMAYSKGEDVYRAQGRFSFVEEFIKELKRDG